MGMGWTKGKGNDRPDIVQIENNTLVADPQGKWQIVDRFTGEYLDGIQAGERADLQGSRRLLHTRQPALLLYLE
jgi:hypothetical protein